MRFSLVVFGLACLHTLANGQTPSGLSVAVEWKYLDWTYPSVQLTGKPFIFNNSFTQDVDLDEAGRIFVTSPQWLDGVPITLSSVTEAEGPGGPLLTPYPDWTWHTPNDCNKLVSVYRMAVSKRFLSKNACVVFKQYWRWKDSKLSYSTSDMAPKYLRNIVIKIKLYFKYLASSSYHVSWKYSIEI